MTFFDESRPRDVGAERTVEPLLLTILAVAQFTAFVDRNLPAALAPLIKNSFHLSDTALGALQGPYFIGVYTLAILVGGFAAGLRERLRVLAGCVLVWTAGGVLIALSQTFTEVIAGRLLVGLGQGVFAPCALSFFTGRQGASASARRLSIYTASSSVGRSAAFLLVGAILAVVTGVSWTPWRTATLAMIAPNLILVALLLGARNSGVEDRLIPNPSASKASVQLGGAYRPALAWLLAHPVAGLCVFLSASASVTAVQTLTAWGASVLHRQFGVSPATAALDFGIALVPAALLGHLGGGMLIDRLGRTRWTPLDLIVAGLAVACAGAGISVTANGAILAGASLAIATLGAAAAGLAGLAAMQGMSPAKHRGPLGAVFLGVTSLIGFGVGPITTGMISDHGGQGPTVLSGSLAIVIGVVAVVGAAAAFAGRAPWLRAKREASADANLDG